MNERIWKLLQKEWLADNKKQTALRSILKIDEWIQQILNAWLEELMNLLDNNIYFDTTTKDYKSMNWFLIKAERRGDKSFQKMTFCVKVELHFTIDVCSCFTDEPQLCERIIVWKID
jgi:hypothetical protein